MRVPTVRLIDLGLQEDFANSMTFAQSMIQSMGGFSYIDSDGDGQFERNPPLAEVEYVRSRDVWTAASALSAPALMVHVMAHGVGPGDAPGFYSHDGQTELDLEYLACQLDWLEQGVQAHAIFVDGCSSAIGRFQRAMRECLEHDIAYVGATRAVFFPESTVFAGLLYGALFRNKGKGVDPRERVLRAARSATDAYAQVTGKPAPFRAVSLPPTRKARARFASRQVSAE